MKVIKFFAITAMTAAMITSALARMNCHRAIIQVITSSALLQE